jgi:hypothetical protein
MTTTETRQEKKATGRVNAITGIIVDKVKRETIVESQKKHSQEIEDDSTTEQLAVQLWTVFEPLPTADKVRCMECCGIGPEADENCGYCGHDEGEAIEAAPAAPAATVTPITEAKDMKKVTAAAEEAPKGKGKKDKKATTNGHVSGAIVPADDTKASSEVQTVGQLDEAVKNVQTLKGNMASGGWALGAAIQDIYKRGLWKLRGEVNDKGKFKARWASFEAFCNAELSMTPQHARTLMDVSSNYSEAQVRAWGTTKLGLVLSAPPEDRPRIQQRVEEGAAASEVRDEVKKTKRKKGHSAASRAGDKRGGKTGQKGKAVKQITVASILGTQTVRLYKKPDSMKGVELDKLPRAKKLGDQPIGVLELANDVRMMFSVSENTNGELQIKVVTQRDEG